MSDGAGQLVVVLCTERSGSTLLTTVLGGHPYVLAPPELHLFRYGSFDEWQREYPKATESLAWLLEELGQAAEEKELAVRFKGKEPASIYRDLTRLCGTGRFLIDKSPAYARDPEILVRVEGLEPLYIWLMRHPLGVAASLIVRQNQSYFDRISQARRIGKRAKLELKRLQNEVRNFTGANLKAHLQRWCETHAIIEDFVAELPEQRWCKVKYEELVSAPEPAIERICDWMAIEPDPNMLKPWENVPSKLVWDLGDEQVRQHHRFDPEVASQWRDYFDESVLDQRTREIMERFEYADTKSLET